MIVHIIIATRYDPCQSIGMRCTDALLYPFCSSALLLWWTLHSLSSHFHLHQPDNDIIGPTMRNKRLTFGERWKKEEKLTASINCLTSYSDNFVPCLASPCFSSSSVIVPLLSVSMPLNIFFNPMISSSDRQPAITYTHFKKKKGRVWFTGMILEGKTMKNLMASVICMQWVGIVTPIATFGCA